MKLDPGEPTDEELIARHHAGDETAFPAMVARHRGKLAGFARRYLRNECDVEEVVNDAFMRAWRGLPRFRGDSSFATWLTRIVINLAKNKYWWNARRKIGAMVSLDAPREGFEGGACGTLADLVPAASPDAAREVERAEFEEIAMRCIEAMPEFHREAMRLRAVLNLDYETIAARLNINVGTVKSRLSRARAMLQEMMAEQGSGAGKEDAA